MKLTKLHLLGIVLLSLFVGGLGILGIKEAYENGQNEVVFNRRSLRAEREIKGFYFKQEIVLSELDGSMYIDEGSSVLE